MKIYKVDQNGKLVTPIEVLRRIAQTKTSSDSFEVGVTMKLCYKMSDDGKRVDVKPTVIITDKKGNQSSFSHLGLGEEELIGQMFSIGGRVKAGMTKNVEYEKVSDGFADNPDLFTDSTIPPVKPPPGTGVLSPAAEKELEMQENKNLATSPQSDKVIQ